MTEQKFKTGRKIKLAICVLITLLGTAMLTISLVLEPTFEGFSAGFRQGTAFGLIGSGIGTFIANLIILRNTEKLKKEYIKRTDERAIAMSKTAFQHTYWITFIGLIVGGFVGAFFNEIIAITCCAVLFGMLIVYGVCFLAVNSRS